MLQKAQRPEGGFLIFAELLMYTGVFNAFNCELFNSLLICHIPAPAYE